ncbi:hypothetical protein BHM03_00045411 [Ensete ventricosum]|nr:hypothetical protein BHM03_00045411 [Ensete ventricosum]
MEIRPSWEEVLAFPTTKIVSEVEVDEEDIGYVESKEKQSSHRLSHDEGPWDLCDAKGGGKSVDEEGEGGLTLGRKIDVCCSRGGGRLLGRSAAVAVVYRSRGRGRLLGQSTATTAVCHSRGGRSTATTAVCHSRGGGGRLL